ncbi:MAG: glycosyltransferase [Elusimicrobia bacterium]|nr:glycosyltransferase [Elusimicrobiota bacterium]
MNSNPEISIIMPVYKVEKYLARCLDSVMAQTFENFEIICVNDGSPDNCADILKRYAQKDKRFKITTQQNQGLSVARNNGMKETSGKYIYFLDSDDFMHPQLLETAHYFITKYNKDVVCFTWFEEYYRYSENIPPPPEYHVQSLPFKEVNSSIVPHLNTKTNGFEIWFATWAKLYSREILEGISFMSGIYYEDVPFFYALAKKNPRTIILKTPLYYYLRNENSITQTFSAKHLNDLYTTMYAVYEIYKDNPQEFTFISKGFFHNAMKDKYKLIAALQDKSQKVQFSKDFAQNFKSMRSKGMMPLHFLPLKYFRWFLRFQVLSRTGYMFKFKGIYKK